MDGVGSSVAAGLGRAGSCEKREGDAGVDWATISLGGVERAVRLAEHSGKYRDSS